MYAALEILSKLKLRYSRIPFIISYLLSFLSLFRSSLKFCAFSSVYRSIQHLWSSKVRKEGLFLSKLQSSLPIWKIMLSWFSLDFLTAN